MFSKEEIAKEYLRGKTLRYSESANETIKSFIDSQVRLDLAHKEKVYCYLHDNLPKCLICTSIPKFHNFKVGFGKYCSVSCQVKGEKVAQENTRIKKINESVIDLTIEDIVKRLYTKELKIQKWRDIEKLKDFTHFNSIKELYNYLILNKTCKYCGNVLGFNNKTNTYRKCACDHKNKIITNLNVLAKEDFIKEFIKNKYYRTEDFAEIFYKHIPKIPWTKSVSENLYCFINNINENPDTEYINIKLGYKNKEYTVDYSKNELDVIEQFKQKYGLKGIYNATEVHAFLKDKYGNSIKEKIYLLSNHIQYCHVCGEISKFNKHKNIYLMYCSKSCANKGDAKNKTQSMKNGFIKTKLEEKLKIYNVSLLTKYTKHNEIHSFKCNVCNEIFYDNFDNGVRCKKCFPLLSGTSKYEQEIFEFIKMNYSGTVINRCKNLDNITEIDIFLPELNFGIEFNGLYWHSSRFKDKMFHLNKTLECEKQGIQLLHVYEDAWLNKKEIVKSMILGRLKINDKIYARKCTIKNVASNDANSFLNTNHLQGKDNTKYRYGLYYNDELVQLITFKTSHRSKEKYLELKRSCSKLNTTVIGGFSKLIKYAINELKQDIVTFADRSFSTNENVYSKNKFELVSTIAPGYKYLINGVLESREKYQKHKLSNYINNYDSAKTEKENMNANGFYEVYDSGNYKYILKYN